MTQPRDNLSDLTLEALRAELSYDAATGVFVRHRVVNQAGPISGWRNPKTGYIIITVFGRKYMAHRLAWFYAHGRWPEDRLDHINGSVADNRLSNLRKATDRENARNQKTRRDSALKIQGVRLHESGKYQARIFDGARFRTKICQSRDEAIALRAAMSSELFGEFARR